MDELLARYGDTLKVFKRGDKIKGKVIKKRAKVLILDIGGKSEGMVAERAFDEARGYIESLKPGDEIEGNVLIPETPEGYVIVSLRHSAQNAVWDYLEKNKEKGSLLKVQVKSANPSGLVVELKGLTGFVPNSHLGKVAVKKGQDLVDKRLSVKIIELDRSSSRIIFSEKAVSEKEDVALAKEAVKAVKEGDVFKGKVITVSNFGAFVEIKVDVKGKKIPIEGLVHVSELSWEKVDDPKTVLSEGEKVEVKVIGISKNRIALSIKQAEKDPWKDIAKRYKADKKVKGKVAKISDFGVFVRLEPGIEGLIHITKIPPGKKLEKGQEVNAYVEEVDEKERKISLGLILTSKPVGYK